MSDPKKPVAFKRPWFLWRIWQVFMGMSSRTLSIKSADLHGKNVVISGGNNGIGKEVALIFASWGANVTLACRPEVPSHETHPDQAVEECIAAARAAGREDNTIEWWPIDMAKLDTLETFVRRWEATERPLDILINNAGTHNAQQGVVRKTTDGFELLHQVNFLSHVYLTLRLLGRLMKAHAPRIICSSSCLHFLGRFHTLPQANSTIKGYASNKLWLQVWIAELQRRMLLHPDYRHITIQGVHPGVVRTGIYRPDEVDTRSAISRWSQWLVRLFTTISAPQGGLAIAYAATAPECGPDPATQGVGEPGGLGGGRYFNRIWDAPPMPQAKDPGCRLTVWDYVDSQLGLKSGGILNDL